MEALVSIAQQQSCLAMASHAVRASTHRHLLGKHSWSRDEPVCLLHNLLLEYTCTHVHAEQVRNTHALAAKHSTSLPTSPHLPLPWLCVCCTPRRCVSAKVLDNIGSVDNLEGFSGLRKEDQARVRRAFEQGYVEEAKEAEDKVRVL